MGERKTDCTKLLVCLLYLLTEETKEKITYYMDNNITDGALEAMLLDRDLLPDWFKRYFSGYDPLYGVLHGLEALFHEAAELRLIGFYLGGTRAAVIVELDDVSCAKFLHQLEVESNRARKLARILEEELLRREKEHRKRMSTSPVHAYGHYL